VAQDVRKIPFAFGAKKSNTYQLSTSKYLPTIILFHYSSMGYMNVFVIAHGFASAGGSG
jgi:hypothetical protein